MVAVAEADRPFRSAVLGEGGVVALSLLDNLPPVFDASLNNKSTRSIKKCHEPFATLTRNYTHVKLQPWFILFFKFLLVEWFDKNWVWMNGNMIFSLQIHPKLHPTLSTLMSSGGQCGHAPRTGSRVTAGTHCLGTWRMIFREFIAAYPKHPG